MADLTATLFESTLRVKETCMKAFEPGTSKSNLVYIRVFRQSCRLLVIRTVIKCFFQFNNFCVTTDIPVKDPKVCLIHNMDIQHIMSDGMCYVRISSKS